MDVSPLQAWGIPGFIIVVLAGVVVQLSRKLDFKDAKIEALQEARVREALDARDKIALPLETLGTQSQMIYDKLVSRV